jgi:acetyl-CoA carboxylase carboxyl transferase subunit alpha
MDERKAFNWGMPHPEGFRKALEKMKLAEKFGLPIVTLVDTPGAYPGVGAEERGQARSIAVNLYEMSRLRTPIISALIGEGGSGGALAICVSDILGIMTYAYYSVITPEGCASILWKDSSVNCTAYREEAARALKITSKDLIDLHVADEIIPDPIEGAHRNAPAASQSLKNYIIKHVDRLSQIPIDELVEKRYQRLCNFGMFAVQEETTATNGNGNGNGETAAPKTAPSKIETLANQLHGEENVSAPISKKNEPQA